MKQYTSRRAQPKHKGGGFFDSLFGKTSLSQEVLGVVQELSEPSNTSTPRLTNFLIQHQNDEGVLSMLWNALFRHQYPSARWMTYAKVPFVLETISATLAHILHATKEPAALLTSLLKEWKTHVVYLTPHIRHQILFDTLFDAIKKTDLEPLDSTSSRDFVQNFLINFPLDNQKTTLLTILINHRLIDISAVVEQLCFRIGVIVERMATNTPDDGKVLQVTMFLIKALEPIDAVVYTYFLHDCTEFLSYNLIGLRILTGSVVPVNELHVGWQERFTTFLTSWDIPESAQTGQAHEWFGQQWAEYLVALDQNGYVIPTKHLRIFYEKYDQLAKTLLHKLCKNKQTFMAEDVADIPASNLYRAKNRYCYDIDNLVQHFEAQGGIVNVNPEDSTVPLYQDEAEMDELADLDPRIHKLRYASRNQQLLQLFDTPPVQQFLMSMGDTAAVIYRYHRKHTDTIQHREDRITPVLRKLYDKWLAIPSEHRDLILTHATDIKKVISNFSECRSGQYCTSLMRRDLFLAYIHWLDIVNVYRKETNQPLLEPSKRVALFVRSTKPDRVEPYLLDTIAEYPKADIVRNKDIVLPSFWIPTNEPNVSGKCQYYNRMCPEVDIPGKTSWCDTEHYNLIRLGKGTARRCYYLPHIVQDIYSHVDKGTRLKVQLRPHNYSPTDEELVKITLQIRDVLKGGTLTPELRFQANRVLKTLDEYLADPITGKSILKSFDLNDIEQRYFD